MKQIEEMSADELKIGIFDGENQMKIIQNGVKNLYLALEAKLKEESTKKKTK